MKTHTGVIHGNIIELNENLGLPDGEEVEIQVTAKKKRQPGEGLRRCAGALANDWSAMDDQILAEIERDRLDAPHRELPE
jgi:hypothetical protein